ncbi:cyclic pyranopterin monophosphate synthase MoaC [Alkalibaculum sp. M08DMB]|uniref:Cyclic pyranopterin monophosphate synthase n=1 Tax=Alkalibaculum sporogenes TaxID=2655001 RepID=A0A6A7KAW8_9FIRM|nr:cyclic pyranopterin monophosphate synthase MoaC [Alkalibaculum sporogenes]MPW26668.1 cyclic pyranopterin monophosphate synthase MoaC [Alkalibaculum sporogenes]
MSLTHIDEKGNARMVDVSGKEITVREAVAVGKITMKKETLHMIIDGTMPKGDVLSTARIAGIMGAKKTFELIPMCHNLPIDSVKIELTHNEKLKCIEITAIARCVWKTGIEVEALMAVSITALTIYDMCKAVDKEMVIGDIELVKKTGGKSGIYEKV